MDTVGPFGASSDDVQPTNRAGHWGAQTSPPNVSSAFISLLATAHTLPPPPYAPPSNLGFHCGPEPTRLPGGPSAGGGLPAVRYLATVQALGYGVRHLLETLRDGGFAFRPRDRSRCIVLGGGGWAGFF